jgi:hypothetical protein
VFVARGVDHANGDIRICGHARSSTNRGVAANLDSPDPNMGTRSHSGSHAGSRGPRQDEAPTHPHRPDSRNRISRPPRGSPWRPSAGRGDEVQTRRRGPRHTRPADAWPFSAENAPAHDMAGMGVRSPAYEPDPYSPNENQLEKFLDWYVMEEADSSRSRTALRRRRFARTALFVGGRPRPPGLPADGMAPPLSAAH